MKEMTQNDGLAIEGKKKKKKKRRPRVTPQRPSLRDVDERLGDDYATGEELG